ncbi:concanavalin A-like lectin/glucanase domain-containing protein [Phaeosphaeria sp. MPI-PUGE-AT-0046c]|nr:concanavalin A-like lectin/glucanase domain-containing protein [Phaeosphaeria sp. MPI-PUGE-AT-0046c]
MLTPSCRQLTLLSLPFDVHSTNEILQGRALGVSHNAKAASLPHSQLLPSFPIFYQIQQRPPSSQVVSTTMTLPPFLIFLLALFLPLFTSATYVLKDDYTASSYSTFFSKFTFWTDEDPTEGYVDYVSENAAWEHGLIGNGGHIYLGVDHSDIAWGRGRKSVRLTSRDEYDSGTIVVVDVLHMVRFHLSHKPCTVITPMSSVIQLHKLIPPPSQPSTCGTWPALWLTSSAPTWPTNGEIDMIEQANAHPLNQISIHVKNTCLVNPSPNMTGHPERLDNCAHSSSSGCAINDARTTSFGHAFNAIGGGVYALEWTTSKISVWFWPRGTYTAAEFHPFHPHPRPGEWGPAVAVYEGREGGGRVGCDIEAAFRKQRIVINTTFCGAWAGGTWESSGCRERTGFGSCEEYVRMRPGEMGDAWWGIRGLRVYTWE